ncbi:MAG TPA: hypothetical protein VJU87_13350 [Gemmatimonadaceae bacterium]|nr:hypothetical protein [Gemmatimonadaceae bacterium]
MNHIDLSSVLRQTVSCDLYSNLVTRPTGAAVRGQIEQMLRDTRERTLTVIDFSHVAMIDFSCADEVIAKLLLRYCADVPPHEAYFLFRGVTDEHWEAIEAVLERHGLALVIERGDDVQVEGVLPDAERRTWETMHRLGRVGPADLATALGTGASEVQLALDELWRRRLVMKLDEGYVVVGGAGARRG